MANELGHGLNPANISWALCLALYTCGLDSGYPVPFFLKQTKWGMLTLSLWTDCFRDLAAADALAVKD